VATKKTAAGETISQTLPSESEIFVKIFNCKFGAWVTDV
jgi:hypothetical protein